MKITDLASRVTEKLFTRAFCPVYIVWNPIKPLTPVQQIHLKAGCYHYWYHPRWKRIPLRFLLIISWPLRALVQIQMLAREYGSLVTTKTRHPLWKHVLEQYYLALRYCLPPAAYYKYDLFKPEHRELIDQYFYNHEIGSLFPYLNRFNEEGFQTKQHFTSVCKQHKVPVVEILATCFQGELLGSNGDQFATLPDWDIFVKPAKGSRGEGISRWKYVGENQFENYDGTIVTRTWLTRLLQELSLRETYLIQPALNNHPDIADLSTGALSTIRFVSGRRPAGEVESIAATFKMPVGETAISTNGLNSPVDLNTGTLSRAISYRLLCPGYDVHPDTGATILGRTLPNWAEVLELVQKAHDCFPEKVFIGWDIGLTPSGPILLEGNLFWDVFTVQKPQGVPLGKTQFVDICLECIRELVVSK
jgi:hypothetical protein